MQIEECLNVMTKVLNPIEDAETVSIDDCADRVAAEDITAPIAVPSFPKAAMDGYAVLAKDVKSAALGRPKKMKIQAHLMAGDYQDIKYEKNQCVRVMTGAYIPEGYNAVVKQEDTDYGENWVRIYKDAVSYENYCKVGEDIKKDSVVITKGTKLSNVHAGILASLGIDKVNVIRKARVAVISTGNELVKPGEPLSPGKIYESISHMLINVIKKEGLQVIFSKLCRDDEEEAKALLKTAASEADFIITTGALSVGKMDFLPKTLKEMGAEILFQGADIKPGTPTMASVLDGKVILSLSGNPYAALANFEIYFWDAMAEIMGCDKFRPVVGKARLMDEYRKKEKRRRLVRAYTEEGKVYLPSQVHSSSVLSNMAVCNCMIEFEPEQQVRMGDYVKIRYIKGL